MSTPTQPKTVLAIDPGFDRIGLAVMKIDKDKPQLLFSKCIETSPKDPREQRLLLIGKEIRKVIEKWEPDSLAVETLFFNKNTTSALGVAEARGIIIYEAMRGEVEVFEYSPQAIKIAVTGYGKADKTQIENMVKKLIILPTRETKRLDDEIDAIALGITHLASNRKLD